MCVCVCVHVCVRVYVSVYSLIRVHTGEDTECEFSSKKSLCNIHMTLLCASPWLVSGLPAVQVDTTLETGHSVSPH